MENEPKAGQSLSSVKSVETSSDAKLGQETIKGNEKLQLQRYAGMTCGNKDIVFASNATKNTCMDQDEIEKAG